MKKSIKYAGIASALMMTVSPIAVPMIHIVKAESVATDPAITREMNIKVQTTVYVDPGTLIYDKDGGPDLIGGNDGQHNDITYSVTDENGNAEGQGDFHPTITGLYHTEEDAKNGNETNQILPDVDSDGNVQVIKVKEGEVYYQAVTLLSNDLPDNVIGNILIEHGTDPSMSVTFNGIRLHETKIVSGNPVEYPAMVSQDDHPAIYYIRKVVVGTKPATNPGGNTGTNTGTNTNNNRPVVVAKKGIVTTHTDKSSYDLYNEDNKKVDNRALLANSSWKMDGERTVDGIKQYRVSTHEWVNASDVDFIEDGKVTEGMTVTKLDKPKAILLATTHNTYSLRNSNNEVLTNRALSGGTSWMVDKIGTDMHGGVYYGVSNDEFVKAQDGVDASL